jgi:predicted short-subunit dehydrogenase-like oxidoreductase (DUF2520 family)
MRELERDLPANATLSTPAAPGYLAIVGKGRAGRAIQVAARARGIEAALLGRDESPRVEDPAAAAVLLCVPDPAIAAACERIAPSLAPGTPVGHVSGATPLTALRAATDRGCPAFSLHPLQTIPAAESDLAGASCAVAGSEPRALELARHLAVALGMTPFEVPDSDRAAYHAAAAIASNFLITLEESAAELLAEAGVDNAREVLAPIVFRTVANWADHGRDALTGPIARGDEETVELHLRAIAERAPELAPLYEALAERTRAIAAKEEGE